MKKNKNKQKQMLTNIVEFCNRNDSEVILTFPFYIPNTLNEFSKFLKQPLSVISQSFVSLRTDPSTTKDEFTSTQRGFGTNSTFIYFKVQYF